MRPWHGGETEVQQAVVAILKGYFIVEKIGRAQVVVEQHIVEMPVIQCAMLRAIVFKSKSKSVLEVDGVSNGDKNSIECRWINTAFLGPNATPESALDGRVEF